MPSVRGAGPPVRFALRRGSFRRAKTGGADRNRTCDLLIANETLYQLSYDPTSPDAEFFLINPARTQPRILCRTWDVPPFSKRASVCHSLHAPSISSPGRLTFWRVFNSEGNRALGYELTTRI